MCEIIFDMFELLCRLFLILIYENFGELQFIAMIYFL